MLSFGDRSDISQSIWTIQTGDLEYFSTTKPEMSAEFSPLAQRVRGDLFEYIPWFLVQILPLLGRLETR